MSSLDLQVQPLSTALSGKNLDLVVSGSIGAVESVRFARALRRLGAEVFPWLTAGGAQFVTETALSWGAARAVSTSFSGDASHVAQRDGVVVAPASADFISKMAQGISDTPALALVASYLGQRKPVLLLPNMHDSLLANPFFAANLQKVAGHVTLLGARTEENKQKFPEPDVLASEVAHTFNSTVRGRHHVVVTLGTTRGYIDDVRYVSNYSSGGLGSEIVEELYRQGFETTAIVGPCLIQPKVSTRKVMVDTTEGMAKALADLQDTGFDAAVLAASVLDFVPEKKATGKISSQDDLTVKFIPTPKLIAAVKPRLAVKVGFKLEASRDESRWETLAHEYQQRYGLSLVVANALDEVSSTIHKATFFEAMGGQTRRLKEVEGKIAVAHEIVAHVQQKLPLF